MFGLVKNCLAIGLLACFLGACASTAPNVETTSQKDPFETVNRAVYGFNDGVDRILLKPVAKGYQKVTPSILKTGLGNFFFNLGEIRSVVNSALQGNGEKMLNHAGRFIMNTSFGLGGLIDIGHEMGLKREDPEDFGQTLAVWGVKSGPYLMLPFFGPSTIRDGGTTPVDTYLSPLRFIQHDITRYSTVGAMVVDNRASILDVEKLIVGDDKYVFIRDTYFQRRNFLIKNGKVDDGFESTFDNQDF